MLRPRLGAGPAGRAGLTSGTGAEGIGPLAGDRVDAMFGFQGTPVGRPLRDVAAEGARPAVRADDLRLEGLHLDGHRVDAPRLPPGGPHLDRHRPGGVVPDHGRRRGPAGADRRQRPGRSGTAPSWPT